MADSLETYSFDPKKRDLVAMVSHELRTPLTAIQAALKLLSAGILGDMNDDQKGAVVLALNNLDRMGRLLNELLDFSKVEAGKLELNRRKMDLTRFILDLARTFDPLARERGLEMQAVVPEVPVEAFVDHDKVAQILTNLVHNALKFTPKGLIQIFLNAQGDYIECSVQDTGVGIAPKDIDKTFAPFEQVRRSTQSPEKGTGLGLALCKRLAELHNGAIHVESELGRGTRFTLLLPKISPERFFKEEFLKLLGEAQATNTVLSILRLEFVEWKNLVSQVGADQAARLLSEFEMLLKTCLRDDRDLAVQVQGGVWVALAGVSNEQVQEIASRLRQTLEDAARHRRITPAPEWRLHVSQYPGDIRGLEDLLL